MAESFSVRAILSAQDTNFTSTFKRAQSTLGGLKSSIASGLGFGILAGVGQRAFDVVTRGVTGMIGELNDSSVAWKTFDANMRAFGKSSQIPKVKKELKSFAQQTIYSASDMASTYSQLAAVGTKNTAKLVTGFAGLASAAQNPKQAMKTLSQQATQMAARPKVAWQDFKLMLEQTPAGIAAVAKEMGKSAKELVADVQAGKVATDDFFEAVARAGNSDAFAKMAREYKTVGQAMDGLKETAANQLAPAFDVLSHTGIRAVEGLINSFGRLDGNAIAGKVLAFVTKAKGYWEVFKDDAGQVVSAFSQAGSAILSSLSEINGAFGSTENIQSFSDVLGIATGALVSFAGFLEDHSSQIAQLISLLPKLAIAYGAFKIVSTLVPGVALFGGAILKLAGGAIGGLAAKLFGIAGGETAAGNAGKTSGKKMLTAAKAMLMMGAATLMVSAGFALLAQSAIAVAGAGPGAIAVLFGLVGAVAALGAGMVVALNSIKPGPAKLAAMSTAMLAMGAAMLMVSAGFALLTQSAIALAGAGPLAIGVMVGMVGAIALLAAGAAAIGPALTAGAVGFVAFGAAIALIGVGAYAAAAGLAIVAGVLPTVTQYGAAGAIAIAQLGAGMIVFAAGAAIAGGAAVLLGAGLTAAGAGAAVAAVGVLALGAAVLVLSAGILLAGAGVTMIAAALPAAGAGATSAAAGIAGLSAALLALSVSLLAGTGAAAAFGATALVSAAGVTAFGAAMGVSSAGAAAMAVALLAVNANMKSISKNANSTAKALSGMQASVSAVQAGLNSLGNMAQSAMNGLSRAFDNGVNKAKSAGQQIGKNMQNGVRTGLNPLPSIATQTMTRFNAGIQSGGTRAVSTARRSSASIVSALNSARGGAHSAGVNIGAGLASGMASQLGRVRSIAAQLAAAAAAAIRAKAQIHSPSRVTARLGAYFGEGFADGIEAMSRDVRKAAERLIAIPSLETVGDIRLSGTNMSLNDEHSYSSDINARYTIVVPVEIDGRETARATAKYTQDELEKISRRENRRKGKV